MRIKKQNKFKKEVKSNSKELHSNSSYNKKYEFIDITTSDTAFIAYGRTLSELFENAALATFAVMIDLKKFRAKETRVVEVTGHDLMALMFNWINELLVYVDSENLAFSKFDVKVDERAINSSFHDSHNTNNRASEEIVKSASQVSHNTLKLRVVCKGERIDQKKHKLGTVVKSCTYHKMEIIKKEGVWRAQVILDI